MSKGKKCAENGFKMYQSGKSLKKLQLEKSMYQNPMLLLFSTCSGTHSLQMRSTGNLNVFYLFKRWLSKSSYWSFSFIVYWGKKNFTGSNSEPAILPFRRELKDHLNWVTNTGWCHFQDKIQAAILVFNSNSRQYDSNTWSDFNLNFVFTKYMTLGHMLKALSLLCQCWSKEALFETLRDQQMTLAELECNCKECTAN